MPGPSRRKARPVIGSLDERVVTGENLPRVLKGGLKVPRIPERTVQADIVRLLRTLGFAVWVTGTVRPRGDHPGTCMTPGLADILAFGRGRLLCVEVKARGGQLRPSQVAFRDECQAAGVAHVAGGVDDVVDWLIRSGVVAGVIADAVVPPADVPEEGEAD
jgi:hypothetical protein